MKRAEDRLWLGQSGNWLVNPDLRVHPLMDAMNSEGQQFSSSRVLLYLPQSLCRCRRRLGQPEQRHHSPDDIDDGS